MVKLTIHKSIKAENDLDNIWDYSYASFGENQANKYLDKLNLSLNILANHPNKGTKCDNISKGYYKYHINKHMIFYRISNEIIEIIRVLHESMDFQQHFND